MQQKGQGKGLESKLRCSTQYIKKRKQFYTKIHHNCHASSGAPSLHETLGEPHRHLFFVGARAAPPQTAAHIAHVRNRPCMQVYFIQKVNIMN